MSRPLVTVLIVAYNSVTDLQRCLPSIFEQRLDDPSASVDILVIDNATDGATARWLEQTYSPLDYPNLRVDLNTENTGYAGGNNLGLEKARGEFVLVLNPDTVLRPDALQKMLDAAQGNPKALVTPKLLKPDGTINACGLDLHYTGLTTCRGLDDEADSISGTHAAPLVSGAAVLASRDTWAALGGFDSSFFMYMEDAELSLRARALGYDVVCASDAVVTHYYSLGMSPNKFYYLERNRLLLLFKLVERRTLLRLLPALFLTEAATSSFALLKGWTYLTAKLRGYRWLWSNRQSWLRTRRELQQRRVQPDTVLFALSGTQLPLSQLVSHRGLARLLNNLTHPLYRLMRPQLSQES